jgi:hypothetical protein
MVTRTGRGGQYYVAPINGLCEAADGSKKQFNSFTPTGKVINEFTFRMPKGNLTIDISFTTEIDETNAFLRWFGTDVGEISSSPSTFEYTVVVPYIEKVANADGLEDAGDTHQNIAISAQAENQSGAKLTLKKGIPGDGDELDINNSLTLDKGLNEYTITVTSQDGNNTTDYKIRVILLPDFSLKEFKVYNNNTNNPFTQDLAAVGTQIVYVPSTEYTITVQAEANDPNVTVKVDKPSVTLTSNSMTTPEIVTVTVTGTNLMGVPGLDEAYITKKYILRLFYGLANKTTTADAKGGDTSFVPVQSADDGSYYEIHTFRADMIPFNTQAVYDLVFTNGTPPDDVEVLVVGGGGGGGNSEDNRADHEAGGGGAGGYVYVSEYPLGGSTSIPVKVGAGGSRRNGGGIANNGKDSEFGGITAYGGGGGGGHFAAGHSLGGGAYGGRSGGSGGGGAPGNVVVTATKGEAKYINSEENIADAEIYGHDGASGAYSSAGGGGGAGGEGGVGGSGGPDGGALGGVGTLSIISGQPQWYAGGGAGSAKDVAPQSGQEQELAAYGATKGESGDPGTGDGGSGGGGVEGRGYGGNGGSGIVIVRWKHEGNE